MPGKKCGVDAKAGLGRRPGGCGTESAAVISWFFIGRARTRVSGVTSWAVHALGLGRIWLEFLVDSRRQD